MSDIPPKDALEQKPESKEEKRKTPEPKTDGPSADFAALIHAIKTEGRAYRREEQREDRGKKIREWITIGLIACTFVAVCWQVYEMILVYGPIRDQAVASGKQAVASEKAADATTRAADATTKAAEATVKAADAATKQSEIASKQAESSDKAALQAQRAWVGPRDARFETKPATGQKNKVIVEYQNTGREPALGFIFDANPFAMTLAEEANGDGSKKVLDYMQKCVNTPARILAGVVYPTTGFATANLSVPIDEKLTDDDVVAGKKMLIIQGCFAYQTGNLIRHSAFCYFYHSERTDVAHLNICTSGNYAD
jgi:uncharacterized protein YecT (DUF1311 family)